MKYLILLSGLLSTSFAYSAPMSEELSICYKFKSNELVHEVLESHKPRLSVTGWLRRD